MLGVQIFEKTPVKILVKINEYMVETIDCEYVVLATGMCLGKLEKTSM